MGGPERGGEKILGTRVGGQHFVEEPKSLRCDVDDVDIKTP